MHRIGWLALVALILVPSGAQAAPADLKAVVDKATNTVQGLQNEDGSYGSEESWIETTSLILRAYVASHRRYEDSDGPFFRDATNALSKALQKDGGGPGETTEKRLQTTSWILLGLQTSRTPIHRDGALRAQRFLQNTLAEGPELSADMHHLLFSAGVYRPALGELDGRHAQSMEILSALGQPLEAAKVVAERDRIGSAVLEGRALDREDLVSLVRVLASTADDTWQGAMTEAILSRRMGNGLFSFGGEPVADTAAAVLALRRIATSKSKASSTVTKVLEPIAPPSDFDNLDARYKDRATLALRFLEERQNQGRFSFLGEDDPGITALALTAIFRTCQKLQIPAPSWTSEGLSYLASLAKKDGSIFKDGLKVYVTSASIMAFVASGTDKYADVIGKAKDYLALVQCDETEGYSSEGDWAYGGIGYGGDLRPDLSNTQLALEALHDAGVPPGDETFSRALIFLGRCQNNEESGSSMIIERDGQTVVPGNDGGAMYFPGDSKAGYNDAGDGKKIARSYGSMTYALLKSYVFAGLDREDPRVQAAFEWIRRNFTLQTNPGFDPKSRPGAEYQGLYYYYFTLAKALDAFGIDAVETEGGVKHPWRQELAAVLFSEQKDEGFWTNSRSERWMEGDQILATSYALVALSYCFATP